MNEFLERLNGQVDNNYRPGAAILCTVLLALVGTLVLGGNDVAFAPMLLLALAATGLGTLIGFLFGIPRVNADGASAARLRVNTNIEEISDWLTKILVGLSLANLNTLPQLFSRLAQYLVSHGFASKASEGIIAPTSVFFLIDGFLFGYLATRLYLTGAFLVADPAAALKLLKPALASLSVDSDGKPQFSDEAKKAAEKVVKIDPANLKGADQLALWAKAQLGLGNARRAIEGYAAAVREAPDRADLRVEHASAMKVAGESRDRVLRELQSAYDKAGADPRARRQAVEGLMLNYLFVPGEFDRVLSLGTQHLSSGGQQSGKIHMYLAAAWGQKHHALAQTAPPAELAQLRQKALGAATRSLALDSSLKPLFSQMLEGVAGDNDLIDFQKDPEFDALLRRF